MTSAIRSNRARNLSTQIETIIMKILGAKSCKKFAIINRISASYMFPCFFTNYKSNRIRGYVEKLPKLFKIPVTRSIKFANFYNLRFCQFMHWVSNPFQTSAFRYLISSIVCASPQPKMTWTNTCSIVAGMANAHPFRNSTFMHFPRYSITPLTRFINLDLSITKVIYKSLPIPTRRSFFNLTPKSNFYWNYFRLPIALRTMLGIPIYLFTTVRARLKSMKFFPFGPVFSHFPRMKFIPCIHTVSIT